MIEISSFFEKFSKILTAGSLQREKVALILSEVLSVAIDPKCVTIKNGTASVTGSSVLRSELMLKKNLILERLKNDPSTAGIREVR